MKNIVFVLIALLSLQCTSKDGITHDVSKLPVKAQEFLSTYFPEEEISYIKIDKEIVSTMYEVVFVSLSEVDFTKDGDWTEVDCKRSEVPAGIVPEKIAAYVTQNFADSFITKIEKDGNRYEVDLFNGLDLHFDKNHDFIGAD